MCVCGHGLVWKEFMGVSVGLRQERNHGFLPREKERTTEKKEKKERRRRKKKKYEEAEK